MGADPLRQRRVLGPAGVGGAAEQVAGEQHEAAQRQHPERQRVDPREGHVEGADLQRHDVVPEAGQDRDDEQEDHGGAVHGEQLVVALLAEELGARLGQLDADEHRQQPGDGEPDVAVDQVHDPDLLVVGGGEPLHDRVAPRADAVRAGCGLGAGLGDGHVSSSRRSFLCYLATRVPVIAAGWTSQR
jgi:hypothetical protein